MYFKHCKETKDFANMKEKEQKISPIKQRILQFVENLYIFHLLNYLIFAYFLAFSCDFFSKMNKYLFSHKNSLKTLYFR